MGSPEREPGRGRTETLLAVTLKKPFEMQVTPVTQTQWELLMGENPSHFRDGTPSGNHPVENVSWNDAQRFIQKLNELDPHYNYRLPTEAEWEYAVRAGTTTAYSFGDDDALLSDYVWSAENSGRQTHAVAGLKPNPAGLHDMHGNVWEWVQDMYAVYPPGGVDPVVDSVDKHSKWRVMRGGANNNGPQDLRSAARIQSQPSAGSKYVGLRLVRTPR